MAYERKALSRVDDRIVQDIKDALTLSSVIGRHVKLTRSGRDFVGLSPFAKEKTPSFYVMDAKQFYYCFSSGQGGDLFTYIMWKERISFPEALERLAAEAGITIPAPSSSEAEARRVAARTLDLLAATQTWFQDQLSAENDGAERAREYLLKRGLAAETLKQFHLGLAPKSGGLLSVLAAKGFTEDEMAGAGVSFKGTGGKSVGRFRNRVTFAIEDVRGRVISFGGRALDPTEKAKYLNGPETKTFSKGSVLFGLPRAVALLSSATTHLVVVEGYLDVIACQRASIPAVAPLGTAMTEGHIRLAWQKCDEPVLCFDADDAGKAASMRLVARILPLLQPGKSFRICYLTGAKDPDELFSLDGAEALRGAIGRTTPLFELAFRYACGAEPVDTPERKVAAKDRLRDTAALIEHEELRAHYLAAFMDLCESTFGPRQGFDAAPPEAQSRNLTLYKPSSEVGVLAGLPSSLLVAAIENPDWMFPFVDELARSPFGDSDFGPISTEILDYYDNLPEKPDWPTLPPLEGVLIESGFGEFIEKANHFAAPAPFMNVGLGRDNRLALWLRAFTAVNRLHWLTNLFAKDNGDLQTTLGSGTYYQMRFEADSLTTALANGYIWEKRLP